MKHVITYIIVFAFCLVPFSGMVLSGSEENVVTLDLADGSIMINSIGYVQGGINSNHNGNYIIKYTGGGSNCLSFRDGVKTTAVLDNVNILAEQTGIKVDEGSQVELILRGENSVKFPAGTTRIGTAVSVGSTSHLIIDSETATDKLTVLGGAYGAGIGSVSDDRRTTAKITINGGVIIASTHNEGAGIGGGRYGSAVVEINGGTIIAASVRNGAAIGAGREGVGGSVTINGGNIVADAGGAINSNGIGGTYKGNVNFIKITGGVVTAISGHVKMDGIGSGLWSESPPPLNLYISGGSVKSLKKGVATNSALTATVSETDNRPLILTKVNLPSGADSSSLVVDGKAYKTKGSHVDDTVYYVYLPSGNAGFSCSGATEGYVATTSAGTDIASDDWTTPSEVKTMITIDAENITVQSGSNNINNGDVITVAYKGNIEFSLSKKVVVLYNGNSVIPVESGNVWKVTLNGLLSDGQLEIKELATEMAGENDFRFSTVFGDNMILQQNKLVNIFGFGPENGSVRVSIIRERDSFEIESETVLVDSNGKWSAVLQGQQGSFEKYTIKAVCAGVTKVIYNVLFGEVWVSGGQSNMEWPIIRTVESGAWEGKARNPNIRIFIQNTDGIVSPLAEPNGYWVTAELWNNIRNFSAIAYYFAETLYQDLQVPIGIIGTAKGGTSITEWIGEQALTDNSEYDSYIKGLGYRKISMYYNARIAPFKGFQAAGIIWYQGEADASKPDVLKRGLPILYDDWNGIFSQDGTKLPFIAAQLAAYGNLQTISKANAAIAEGISEINKISGSAITIPIYDVEVDTTDIHPVTKQPVAERMAASVMGMVYEKPGLYSGPVVESVKVEGNSVIVKFSNVGDGLDVLSDEDTLSGFAIRTSSSLVAVSASITGKDTVKLDIGNIPDGAEITYAYAENMMSSNLANSVGYPALPFVLFLGSGNSEEPDDTPTPTATPTITPTATPTITINDSGENDDAGAPNPITGVNKSNYIYLILTLSLIAIAFTIFKKHRLNNQQLK